MLGSNEFSMDLHETYLWKTILKNSEIGCPFERNNMNGTKNSCPNFGTSILVLWKADLGQLVMIWELQRTKSHKYEPLTQIQNVRLFDAQITRQGNEKFRTKHSNNAINFLCPNKALQEAQNKRFWSDDVWCEVALFLGGCSFFPLLELMAYLLFSNYFGKVTLCTHPWLHLQQHSLNTN